ncbi:hypothetical protein RB653_003707 [Dictyostelium firmibasis]|uniref:Uncharacterized protein n=1 Tax=Dictyostelium firmibasis TaxID=79012 RepID=A0AAN7YRU2_9MYCE
MVLVLVVGIALLPKSQLISSIVISFSNLSFFLDQWLLSNSNLYFKSFT